MEGGHQILLHLLATTLKLAPSPFDFCPAPSEVFFLRLSMEGACSEGGLRKVVDLAPVDLGDARIGFLVHAIGSSQLQDGGLLVSLAFRTLLKPVNVFSIVEAP